MHREETKDAKVLYIRLILRALRACAVRNRR